MKVSDDGTTFLGSSKAVQTKYGQIVKIGFNVEDLEFMLEQARSKESGWVNTEVKTSREGSPYVVLDTYVGGGGNAKAPAQDDDEDPFA